MRYDATANAIEATGLVKRFGKTTALDGVDLTARQGRVLGVLGPERRGQDHGGSDPRHAAPARQRPGQRLRLRRGARRPPGAAAHRPHRPVRVGRRGPVRDQQPHHDRPAARHAAGRRPGPGARAARPLRADRGGRTAGQDLLGRHAAPARPGGQPGRQAPGAVPGRADHRARPAQPERGLGHDPRAGRGRRHGAAHHAVPGRGRPARARHRGHRPRPGDRDRDAGRAQGEDRGAGARGRARGPGAGWPRSPR